MNKREVRTIPGKELRITPVAADGSRTISGTAIVFNSRSVDMGFREVVSPGAVTETLSDGSNKLLLNNHNTSEVLGSTRSGNLKITTDSSGVNFNCKIDMRQSYSSDLAIAVERGDVQGCSFGFRTNQDSWSDDNGTLVRTLEAIEVMELSLTACPAYESTSTSIRSCPKELRSLLNRSDSSEEDGECTCEKDEFGNKIDPDCKCADDEDDNVLVTESERSRMQMKIEIAKRK
jgi:HK97 family phage prohead protease